MTNPPPQITRCPLEGAELDAINALQAVLNANSSAEDLSKYHKLFFGCEFPEEAAALESTSDSDDVFYDFMNIVEAAIKYERTFGPALKPTPWHIKRIINPRYSWRICKYFFLDAMVLRHFKIRHNKNQKNAQTIITNNISALHQANHVITNLGLPAIEFKEKISPFHFNSDEHWIVELLDSAEQFVNIFAAFSKACACASTQLELFKNGIFDRPVPQVPPSFPDKGA